MLNNTLSCISCIKLHYNERLSLTFQLPLSTNLYNYDIFKQTLQILTVLLISSEVSKETKYETGLSLLGSMSVSQLTDKVISS